MGDKKPSHMVALSLSLYGNCAGLAVDCYLAKPLDINELRYIFEIAL